MATRYQSKIPGGRTNLVRNAKMHNIFAQHEHDIMPWIRGKNLPVGFEDLTDGLLKYFSTLGVQGDNLHDVLTTRMGQLGFVTGTLDDKLSAFFEAKSGLGHRGDNEDKFWANNGSFT